MSESYEPINGFEMLDELNESGLSYAFNIFGLFRKKETGELFFGTDAGCSCPSPWEDTTESDLTPIVTATFAEFERAARDFPGDLSETNDLIATVRGLLAPKTADQHEGKQE